MPIGGIEIRWRRRDGGNDIFSFSSSLGVLPLSPPGTYPIKVHSKIPPVITQFQHFDIEFTIENGESL